MGKRLFTPVAIVAAVCVLAMGFVFGVPVGSAQGMVATPPNQGQPAATAAYPAHIHEGRCPEPGDVVFPLNDITPLGVDVSPSTPVEGTAVVELPGSATPAAAEAPGVNPMVAESTTEVDASLEEILSQERAINVHQSAGSMQIYIACGDLTGEPTDGELHIQLQELNNSGYIGEAHLVDNGDGTTTVTVTLMLNALGLPGTPAATPAG